MEEAILRELNAGDAATLERALNMAFAVPKGRSFFEDFPVWSRLEGGPVRFFGIFVGDRLISVAGARKGEAWVGSRALEESEADRRVRVPMGIIGAVATSIDYRGRGLATRVTQAAVEWLDQEGAVFQILWGAEHDLYRRHGFELCGEQMRVPVAVLIEESGPVNAVKMTEGWNSAIFDLRLGFREGLVLSESDREWYSSHRSVRWFWTGPAERPTAYAALGRGIDMEGIVHEWGGDRDAVLGLLSAIAAKEPSIEVFANADILDARGLPIPEADEEFLCMARISDVAKLAAALGIDPQAASALADPLQRVELFFGPDAPDELYFEGLPCMFWMWGLDSA